MQAEAIQVKLEGDLKATVVYTGNKLFSVNFPYHVHCIVNSQVLQGIWVGLALLLLE